MDDQELLRRLLDSKETDPILRWRFVLSRVHGLIQRRCYLEAVAELEQLVASFEGQHGTADERYRPMVLARLSECLFHLGRFAEALQPTEAALEHCEQAGDENGVVANLGNLVEIRRCLGQHLLAERLAERRARLVEGMRRPV